jgi:hypothetical protein
MVAADCRVIEVPPVGIVSGNVPPAVRPAGRPEMVTVGVAVVFDSIAVTSSVIELLGRIVNALGLTLSISVPGLGPPPVVAPPPPPQDARIIAVVVMKTAEKSCLWFAPNIF